MGFVYPFTKRGNINNNRTLIYLLKQAQNGGKIKGKLLGF